MDVLQSSPLVARRARIAYAMDRAGLLLTTLVLAGSLIIMLLAPLLAYRWIQLPFMGAFVEQSLVFNSVGPRGGERWPAIDQGLRFPARLVMLDGGALEPGADDPASPTARLLRALDAYRPGDTVALTYLDEKDQRQRMTVTLRQFPAEDLFAYFILPYLIALAYLAIGLWVFYARWREVTGRAFALFCASVAVAVGGLFDLYTTHAFSWAWTLAVPLAAAGLLTLALVFPQEQRLVHRYPILRWLGFAPGIALAGLGEAALNDLNRPTAYVAAWRNEYAFAGLGIAAFLGWMLYRQRRAPSPIVRGQARVILLGSAFAFGPLLYYLGLTTISGPVAFNVSLYFPPLVIFPLAVAVAILRFRLLDTDRLIGRWLVYALVSLIAGLGYTAVLAVVSIVTRRAVPADNPFFIAVLVAALVVALDPLRRRLQWWVDARFFHGTRAYRERLEAFGRDLTTAADLRQILAHLRRHIDDVVRPAHVSAFLPDRESSDFARYAFDDGQTARVASADRRARFPADGPLARTLAEARGALYLPPDAPLPSPLDDDRDKLAQLDASVFIPLRGEAGLAGWLALGPKLSGAPYTREDLRFLESLGDQSVLAVERTRLFEETRQREQQLMIVNDLAREMTGVFGRQELCAVVSRRLVDVFGYSCVGIFTRDGSAGQVVLQGIAGVYHSRAKPGEYRQALGEGAVGRAAATGAPVLVNGAGFLAPEDMPAGAQLALPLKVGGETIGVLSVDSQRVNAFDESDRATLMTVGDQLAVAMERARLFEQTQQRAAQLSTLNEIGRAVSTLLDVDGVLEVIYQQVRRSLPLDAFFVALFDPETELVSYPLIYDDGRRYEQPPARLTPASNLGRVIRTAEPRLENRTAEEIAAPAASWQPVGDAARRSASLMYAPLVVGAQTIGALSAQSYSLNAYRREHLELLNGAAQQAAIAIQNARLYAEAQRRADEALSLYEVGVATSSSLQPDEVLERIYSQVGRVMDAPYFLIILYDEAAGELRVDFYVEHGRRRPFEAAPVKITPDGRVLAQWIIERRQPLRLADLWDELPAGLAPGLVGRRDVTRAYLGVPLLARGRPIGVLSVQHDSPGVYGVREEALLSTIAAQAAVAIANARLFEAEREQREVAEALRDTAAAINSTLRLDEVLQRILTNVGRVVPHDSASIILVASGVAHLARRQGSAGRPVGDSAVSFRVAEVPALSQMAETGQPLIVPDTRAFPGWVDLAEAGWVRSYAGAPIRRKGQAESAFQVAGFLNLNSAQPGFFSPDHARHLQTFADQAGIAIENAQLFDELQLSNADLALAYLATLEGWSRALELRDQETEGHTQRVAEMSLKLARAFHLSQEETVNLYRGALMHDIGKMGIPDAILLKAGPLTEEEWQIMRRHPVYAYELLSPIEYLRPALDIPYCHHERWDGSGYPRGLRGEDIPLAARIFAVADVWDALSFDRPYRKAWPPEEVRRHIQSLAGVHFDPRVVGVFAEIT